MPSALDPAAKVVPREPAKRANQPQSASPGPPGRSRFAWDRWGAPMSEAAGSDTGTELVDIDALARWMDAEGLPGGIVSDAQALSGGTQNLLMRFRRGGRDHVLRRGPRHLRRASNDVMRRACCYDRDPHLPREPASDVILRCPNRCRCRDRRQLRA